MRIMCFYDVLPIFQMLKHWEESVPRYQVVKGDLCSKTTNGMGEFLGPSLLI